MATATQFEAELGSFGVQIEDEAVARKREAALDILRQVVLGNPVGQPALWKSPAPKGYVGGYSRGNWQMTSGDAADGIVALRSPESVLTEGEEVEVSLEDTTWITNNAPYVARLEYEGWSSQAPDGWIRAAVERSRARYE